MFKPAKTLPLPEFVILLAAMISIVALSTDIMLPALDVIGADLGLINPNDAQFIVSSLFLGFAFGQMVAGPLSDSFGRKPVIYAGYAIFILGCVLSYTTQNWTIMIIGRVLQGLGAAFPRIITTALIRDCYEGRDMARIVSVIMAVFILVPTIAPALGEVIITLSDWRATFAVLIVMALIGCLWFALRQPETLPNTKRRPFSLRNIAGGIKEILSIRQTVAYTLASGLIFGAFLSYLATSQQIFQDVYQAGPLFALYFAIAALALGTASLINSTLVMRYGMRLLIKCAAIGISVTSLIFLAIALAMNGIPPLWLFMTWLLSAFLCIGILFGNLNAIAMEPLGHMAGLGAALIGSLSNFISLPLAWLIGANFNGTVTPMVAGFALLALGTLAATHWAERA